MQKEIVMPNYDYSILSTITSILKYYNVQTGHKSLNSLDDKLKKKYKNIVLIILDGMGDKLLNQILPNEYFENNKIDCVTSVCPSTTTAAMTTYYSGKPPYETGWIAWSQYFKEYGRAIDMLPRRESYLGDNIKAPRINVFEDIINYETIYEKIEKASPNVKAYEIGLSNATRISKRSMRADNIDEIIEDIQDICLSNGEKFILAYSDNPDKLFHKFGTTSVEAKEFLIDTQDKLNKMLDKLEDTLVIISADHGHKDIEKAYSILDYPEINECLIMPVSLESRILTFWVKEDMKNEFEKRFKNAFNDEFLLLTKQEFMEKHFLGYGEKHPKIDDFIGNYVAISTAGSIIRLETYLAEGKPIKKSTHCGLTRDEMEVPVIVIEK